MEIGVDGGPLLQVQCFTVAWSCGERRTRLVAALEAKIKQTLQINSFRIMPEALVQLMGRKLLSSERVSHFCVGSSLLFYRKARSVSKSSRSINSNLTCPVMRWLFHEFNFLHQRVLHLAQRQSNDVICNAIAFAELGFSSFKHVKVESDISNVSGSWLSC
jgi:hypothetical protein